MRFKIGIAAVLSLFCSTLMPMGASATVGNIYINSVDTGVPWDCARVGTAVSGQNAHYSLLDLQYQSSSEDVPGSSKTPAECADAILAFMKRQVRGEFLLTDYYVQQLGTSLFSGSPGLSKPYEVFLKNMSISLAALSALSLTDDDEPTGLGSCYISDHFLVIHCIDDVNGGFIARDQATGDVIYVGNGIPWYIPVSGLFSQSGGTMWGNAFLENRDEFPLPMVFDRWVEHHEQVHSQQWAQYGWNFVEAYGTAAATAPGNALYFYLTWGKVDGVRVPAGCFNAFERYAGFSDGNYAMRWNERGGQPLVFDFPQADGDYPKRLTTKEKQDSGMCPATW